MTKHLQMKVILTLEQQEVLFEMLKNNYQITIFISLPPMVKGHSSNPSHGAGSLL